MKKIVLLLFIVLLIGCVERTVVEQSEFEEPLEESVESEQPQEEEEEPAAQVVQDMNNSREFKSLIKTYNKTVTRRDTLALDYTYYDSKIGRKGIVTKVYGNEVRLDLFKESSYIPEENIEIIRFTRGDETGTGYCKEKVRCADTSKEVTINVANYPFALPPDMREFSNGWVDSSEYVKNIQVYYAQADLDGVHYNLTIDGATGFVTKAQRSGFAQEWDELRINRITMSDLDV